MELANLETNYGNTQKNIDEKKEFIKITEPEITNIEKKLDNLEVQHISLSEKSTEISTEISEIEKLMNT